MKYKSKEELLAEILELKFKSKEQRIIDLCNLHDGKNKPRLLLKEITDIIGCCQAMARKTIKKHNLKYEKVYVRISRHSTFDQNDMFDRASNDAMQEWVKRAAKKRSVSQ